MYIMIEKIVCPLNACSLEEAVRILIDKSSVKNKNEAFRKVMERESLMSTNIGNGVVLPHAKLDNFDSLVVLLGLSKSGFNNNGEKLHVVILTLSAKSKSGLHVKFLSDIVRILENQTVLRKLINVNNEKEARAVLGEL